jgi:general stress protein 26
MDDRLEAQARRPLQDEHVVAVAKATLDAAEFCFLTTQGESDPISTRLMQHFKPDADLTVWFGTSLTSRKVREIRRNPRVTVACADPQRPAYAVLVGSVTVEERAEQWRRYWRDDWQAFWPEGPTGRDYVPLRFTCEQVEVLSFAAGITPAPYGLRPAVALRHGDGWRLAVDS